MIRKGPQALNTSFATSQLSDFDFTWTWDLTETSSLNSGADRFWFHCSLWTVPCSLVRIWRIAVATSTSFDPCSDVRSEAYPENPKLHEVRCFIFAHIGTGRSSVEVAENFPS